MTEPLTNSIDLATFTELQETTGAEFTAELVDTFLDEAPQLLEQLTAALAAGQADAFRRTAHSLKTNALTFGALTLAAKARELEQQSIESVNADGAHPLHALAQEYARVVAALKALCHAV